MALNGSGIRDTARVVRVSPTTVINTLKKKRQAYSKSMKDCSNVLMLSRCRSSSTRWEAAEVDEMWSFVGSKSQQR
jgi:insertion element IS1 protein InsB